MLVYWRVYNGIYIERERANYQKGFFSWILQLATCDSPRLLLKQVTFWSRHGNQLAGSVGRGSIETNIDIENPP
jgi:hypothetical protein